MAAMTSAPRWVAPAAVVALAGSNVAVNRVLPDAAYLPWNLAMTAAIAALARRAGLDRTALALEPERLRDGVRVGLAAAAGVGALYAAAVVARPDPAVLRDGRILDLDGRAALRHALFRIPLGTVLLEEFAFRGVLPALLRRPGRPGWLPDTVGSLMFGVWHVLPARDLVAANDWAARLVHRRRPATVPVLSVVVTAAAGAGLQALRRRGGHLVAPMLAHWAGNAFGVVASRIARR